MLGKAQYREKEKDLIGVTFYAWIVPVDQFILSAFQLLAASLKS